MSRAMRPDVASVTAITERDCPGRPGGRRVRPAEYALAVDAGFAAAERRRTADSGADSPVLLSAERASHSYAHLRPGAGSREAKALEQMGGHSDQHVILAQHPCSVVRWGVAPINDEVSADVCRATMSGRPGFTLSGPRPLVRCPLGRRASRRLRTCARAVARPRAAPIIGTVRVAVPAAIRHPGSRGRQGRVAPWLGPLGCGEYGSWAGSGTAELNESGFGEQGAHGVPGAQRGGAYQGR
jgi:hypothetical protein